MMKIMTQTNSTPTAGLKFEQMTLSPKPRIKTLEQSTAL
jgi:hypothetical protein